MEEGRLDMALIENLEGEDWEKFLRDSGFVLRRVP